jgi:hypothetical protein
VGIKKNFPIIDITFCFISATNYDRNPCSLSAVLSAPIYH